MNCDEDSCWHPMPISGGGEDLGPDSEAVGLMRVNTSDAYESGIGVAVADAAPSSGQHKSGQPSNAAAEAKTLGDSHANTNTTLSLDQQSQHIYNTWQQPTLTVVLDDEWDITGTALSHPDYLTMQAQAVVAACLDCSTNTNASSESRPSQDVHDHWQVNICLPVHVNEHELTYLLPHVKAGAQRAYEDYDLITVGSIIDDDDGSTSEASANKVEHGSPRRAKDRVTCQLGVLVTTPHVCLQMKRVAAHRDVNFVCFDSDILTTTMFGGHLDPNGISDCSSGKSGACACNAAKFSTHCTCYFGTSGHGLIRENLKKSIIIDQSCPMTPTLVLMMQQKVCHGYSSAL